MKTGRKGFRWAGLLIIVLVTVLLLTGCTEVPRAEIIDSTPTDIQGLLLELEAKIPGETIPEGWDVGIVLEKTWIYTGGSSVGDAWVQVLTLGGEVSLHICLFDEEEECFVAAVNAGDLIIFQVETYYDCWSLESVMVVEKYYLHGIEIREVGFEAGQ
jgi:hypothetical protein